VVRAGRYPGHGLGGQPELPEHGGVDDDHVPDVDQWPLNSCTWSWRRTSPLPLETVLVRITGLVCGRGRGHGVSVAAPRRMLISQ
jgi:hypothetical protein